MTFTATAYVLPPVNAEAINTTTERFGITDDHFVDSSVPEEPPPAYNGATTYAVGAEVSTGTAGGVITCWRSLQAGNIGHTPVEGVWWTNIGTTYSVWAGGTWAEGALVIVVATHSVYERTAASPGTSAVSPEVDVAAAGGLWIRHSTTNRWAMFDMLSTTPTVAVSPLTVVLTPGRISGLALLNIADGGDVVITETSGADEVYSHTETLDGAEITSWEDYFFAEFDLKSNITRLDVPTYTDGEITVEITGGADLAVGKLVVGTAVAVGKTEDAPRVRNKSFSVVERNDFGDVTDITKRKSIPMVSQTVMVEKANLRAAKAAFEGARTCPCVFIGLSNDEDAFAELLTFLGICVDVEVIPKSSGFCPINAEIEGI